MLFIYPKSLSFAHNQLYQLCKQHRTLLGHFSFRQYPHAPQLQSKQCPRPLFIAKLVCFARLQGLNRIWNQDTSRTRKAKACANRTYLCAFVSVCVYLWLLHNGASVFPRFFYYLALFAFDISLGSNVIQI